MVEINPALDEEFTSNTGLFQYYDSYTDEADLANIKHRDARSCRVPRTLEPNLLELSGFTIGDIEGIDLDDIGGISIIGVRENWSANRIVAGVPTLLTSSFGEQADRANMCGFKATMGTAGDNLVVSTLTVPNPGHPTEPTATLGVDLSTDFASSDFISISLPDWQGSAKVDLANSYVELYSGTLPGSFTLAALPGSARVALNASINSLTGTGNKEFRVLRSAFAGAGFDLTNVTAINFIIKNTASIEFRTMGVRLISDDWVFGPISIDTLVNELYRTVPLDGSTSTSFDFTQPNLWRAAEVTGANDPKPIDFEVGVVFNTGSKASTNEFTIYGRELAEDFLTQLDLNGLTMAELTGVEQPDTGAAMYNPRPQSEIDLYDQEQLDTMIQFDLERLPDVLAASWLEFTVQWTNTNTIITLENTEGGGEEFNTGDALDASTNYVFIVNMEGTRVRAYIYPLDERGSIQFNTPFFDSGLLDDDFNYKRRKGRFGWHASLVDGDANINSIRFRSTVFAEYRSLPFASITPADGVELYNDATPDVDLFTDLIPTNLDSIKVERDTERTTSGESYRITDYGQYIYQGIYSNVFTITDFDQTELFCDLYLPSSADSDTQFDFYLKSEMNDYLRLPRPLIFFDQWQAIHLRMPLRRQAQTGRYRLMVVPTSPTNWWIDNIRIKERAVSWSARAAVNDPWELPDVPWVPFKGGFNRPAAGVMFPERDKRVQVRAQGHHRFAAISKSHFLPKYSTLGRLIWTETATTTNPPTADFVFYTSGPFTAFVSTSTDTRQVVNERWTIEGSDQVYWGPFVTHTFVEDGSYDVTLEVIDNHGNIDDITKTVNVVGGDTALLPSATTLPSPTTIPSA